MEILLILSFCMVVLCALCGIKYLFVGYRLSGENAFANDHLVIHLFHNRRGYLLMLCQPCL